MRLLLVEDDSMIGERVEAALHGEHYAVDWVRDGAAAEMATGAVEYDLVLIDLDLPGKDGMTLLRDLRENGIDVPILILAAREGTATLVEALDTGADDFLGKPCEVDELLARVRALLRRRVARTNSVVTHAGLTLDLASHRATYIGNPVNLSAREFAVLRALADTPGSIVSKRQLEEKLYGWSSEVESNAVDVYIHHLRKKLSPDFIRNVRGVGYKLADKA